MTPERVELINRLASLTAYLATSTTVVAGNPSGPIWQPDVQKTVEVLRGFADAIEREFPAKAESLERL